MLTVTLGSFTKQFKSIFTAKNNVDVIFEGRYHVVHWNLSQFSPRYSLTSTEKQKQKSREAELLRFSKEKWLRFEFKHRGPREEGNKSYVVTLAKEFGQVSELHTLPFDINTHNPIALSFFITVILKIYFNGDIWFIEQARAGNTMRLAGWNRRFRRLNLVNGRTDGHTDGQTLI